jgi:hypothetical protein
VKGVVVELVAARLRPKTAVPRTRHVGAMAVAVVALQRAHAGDQLVFHLGWVRRDT